MESESSATLFILFLNLGIPISMIMIAMIIGSILEKKHFKSIRAREQAILGLPAVSIRALDPEHDIADARLVSGSVVVSLDYFKRFLAGLRNIFGGRVRSYESLLDRGRREAILRMKAECPQANIIINFRVETSAIAKTRGGRKQIGGVEVLAYGTAITYQD